MGEGDHALRGALGPLSGLICEIVNSVGQGNFSGAPARAKRARSGAPWVRKFGKLSIPENLVMT